MFLTVFDIKFKIKEPDTLLPLNSIHVNKPGIFLHFHNQYNEHCVLFIQIVLNDNKL